MAIRPQLNKRVWGEGGRCKPGTDGEVKSYMKIRNRQYANDGVNGESSYELELGKAQNTRTVD